LPGRAYLRITHLESEAPVNRTHALIASLAVGLAAVAGVFALDHTLALGTQSHAATDRQVAARTAQLDRYEASLRKALARKPPALPPVPASSTGTASGPSTVAGSSTIQSAAPVRIVYHRPPPIVVIKHRAGGHEAELEGVGADD
jgi:hypothetical protein